MDRLRHNAAEAAAITSGGHRDADIVDLADIGEEDLALVGAKAYHLGLLLGAGFRVPKGFCITTRAFRKSLAPSGGAIRIPGPLRESILDAFRETGIATAAVRSSADKEDLPEASWAGVYPTILQVTTEWELIAAVEECFRSLHGSTASLYRENIGNGEPAAAGAMAVVVQEIVEAESAGVLFTMNPITRDRRELCINAVLGLGEPLASGRVTGDVFTVTPDGGIGEQRISEKPCMLTGAGETPVPEHKRRAPALGPGRIRDLARVGREIEKCFGCPQDVEFAVAGGLIHIIQARPIPLQPPRQNTLVERLDNYIRRERQRLGGLVAAMRQSGKLEASGAIFSNGNIGELLPTPTPMSFGLFRHIFASNRGAIVSGRRLLGYRLEDDATEHMFELICGHPYFNLEIDARTFDIGLPLDIRGYMERIKRDPSLASYPELGLYEQKLTHEQAVARFGPEEGEKRYRTHSDFRANIAARAEEFLREFPEKTEAELKEYLERERSVDISSFSAAALAERINGLIRHLKHFSCVKFVVAARIGFLFTEIVRCRLQEFFGKDGDHYFGNLLQGMAGSRITEQMIDVERVASGEMTPGAFLHDYGHLAPNELEISSPRFSDETDAVARMVQDMKAGARHPADGFREHVREREKVEAEVSRRLRETGKASEEIAAFFAEFRLAQAFLPLRETVKYYYAAEYALIRSALLDLARRTGLEPEEIFYLFPEEIPECLGEMDALREKITRRREERRMAGILAKQKRMPPVIFSGNLEAIGGHPTITVSRKVDGISVSPGAATGTVRILDPESIDVSQVMEELTGNEIIVTRAANLGAAPLLRKAAGLIIEIGGILAHGACQARESGIPAVVMENATVLLHDGARVRVDGDTGTVCLMDDSDSE